MAYNILAESSKHVNWEQLNNVVIPYNLIEYIPMPGRGESGGDAIGISIPSKNMGNAAWEQLREVIFRLSEEYKFELYDMYYGEKITAQLLKEIKRNLTE